MRKIIDLTAKLTPDELRHFSDILHIEKCRDQRLAVAQALLSHHGLHLMLATLSGDEYRLLSATYAEAKGISFGELHTKLRMDVSAIETISARLSKKMLVYVLKNRQRIHNKNDRVYPIAEIREFFNPAGASNIVRAYREIMASLTVKGRTAEHSRNAPKIAEKHAPLISYLTEAGGIASLGDIERVFGGKAPAEIMAVLHAEHLCSVFQDERPPAFTALMLGKNLLLQGLEQERSRAAAHYSARNGYHFLLNIISIFDVISTSGLFMTKQRVFRKVDLARITGGLNRILDLDGTEIDPVQTCGLCLHVMHLMSLVKLKGDSVIATLKPLKQDLDKPRKMLLKLFLRLQETTSDNPIFTTDMRLPSYRFLSFLIETLERNDACSLEYLRGIVTIKMFSDYEGEQISGMLEQRDALAASFRDAVRFLFITGVIAVREGLLTLSEIGKGVAAHMLKPIDQAEEPPASIQRCVYINPDFSLMIPKDEIPPEALYHLLTHTELLRDDVIVNAKISKNSIMKAYKRGMALEPFLSALKQYAKNELPQNLTFMLNEWTEQTIQIRITSAVLLYASQPLFLEELSFGKLKHAVVERISPHHAVIQKEYLDDIIKAAQDRDAVINLFDEPE